jgi:hypothetical protein
MKKKKRKRKRKKNMACKKRKRFMKLELLETSAVGTPAYADAHFSLAKSLSNAYQDLKGGLTEQKMAEEITEKVAQTEVAEVKSEVAQVEKEVEVAEIKSETKEVKTASVDELIATLKEVIAKMPVERALVEKKETSTDKVKSASNGELFLAMLKR